MHYFFAEARKENELFIFDRDVINHYKVLRVKKDEDIIINHDGDIFICRESSLSKKAIVFSITGKTELPENPIKMTLYQGLPKKKKFEFILEKAVETGFEKIIPLKTRFVQQKFDGSKDDRFRSIMLNAAQQSKSPVLPKLEDILDIQDISADNDLDIVLYENGNISLKELLSGRKKPESIGIVIGAEGGLSGEEVRSLEERGFIPVRLSGNVLRTETACIAIGSILKYEFDF